MKAPGASGSGTGQSEGGGPRAGSGAAVAAAMRAACTGCTAWASGCGGGRCPGRRGRRRAGSGGAQGAVHVGRAHLYRAAVGLHHPLDGPGARADHFDGLWVDERRCHRHPEGGDEPRQHPKAQEGEGSTTGHGARLCPVPVVRGNSVHVAGLQRGQKQPEARNGHREWVQVNTGHCVQRPLRDVPTIAARLVA